ncbi:MAG: hypothetical protein Q4B91_09105 [Atopobiaceae bacterium]|nr:hypothetical protein [Atopobiaceae bacterium]
MPHKRKTLLVFATTIICLLLTPLAARAKTCDSPATPTYTDAQIADRLQEINERYDLYEPMSAEDAAFVQEYATPVGSPATRGSSSFSWTKSGGGTQVTVTGNVYHNGTLSYTWGANMDVATISGPTPRSMVARVQCTAYGVLGDNLYGKIYDRTVSRTYSNTRSFHYAPAVNYSGVAAVYSVNASVDVTTSNGSFFTVTGN